MSPTPSARPGILTPWLNSPASCRCRLSSTSSGFRHMARRACWNGPLPPNLFEGYNERCVPRSRGSGTSRFSRRVRKPEKMQHGGLARRIFDEAPGKGVPPRKQPRCSATILRRASTISTAARLAFRRLAGPVAACAEDADRQRGGGGCQPATPIRAFSRYVAEDVEMHGVSMKQGQRVFMPAPIVMKRSFPMPTGSTSPARHRHLGFGQGPHMCMGM